MDEEYTEKKKSNKKNVTKYNQIIQDLITKTNKKKQKKPCRFNFF